MAVSAIIATTSFVTVSLIAPPDITEIYLLTATLAVLAGLIAIIAGLLKLGRVAQFFSEYVMVSFITGLSILILLVVGLGLSTANRNGAAALLVATQNFSGTNTLPFVLVGTVLMLLILLPVAKRMGTSKETPASEAPT